MKCYNQGNFFVFMTLYYPAFRGTTVPTGGNHSNASQLTLQSDTVSFNTNGQIQAETKKQGLSKGAKWGTVGTVAVLGLRCIGIYTNSW